MDRRDFLKLIGISGAIGACSQVESPVNQLIPFVVPPDDGIPGVATWYASVCRQCPSGCGISVKVREGLAKKIEGNPLSPVNQGKLCALGESALQVLYNPDRIKKPLQRVGERGAGQWEEISWEEATQRIVERLKALQDEGMTDRLYIIGSPIRAHLSELISLFTEGFGTPHAYSYDLFDHAVLKAANAISFGIQSIPHYDIAHADYLLSFGANFLERWISPVQYSRAYGEFRQADSRKRRGRFIHCEPRRSLTAANADQWISIRPGSEGILALGLSHLMIEEGWHSERLSVQEVENWRTLLADYRLDKVSGLTDVPESTIRKLAREFSSTRPSLALCGDTAMAQSNGLFHALAVNILNAVAGNLNEKGGLQFYSPFETIEENRLDWHRIEELGQEISREKVKALLLHEANFLFHAPTSLNLQEAIARIPFIASFSSFIDETNTYADLILPTHAALESFGDFIPESDGGYRSVGFMQPVVTPVYDTRPLGDIFLGIAEALGGSVSEQFPWDHFESFLKERWEERFFVSGLEAGQGFGIDLRPLWNALLQNGGRRDETPSQTIAIQETDYERIAKILQSTPAGPPLGKDSFHCQIYPSIFLHDGRGANQPWLQEAPDPITTITWGSWIEINSNRAARLGIKEGDILQVQSPYGSIEVPAYPTSGIREDTLAMPMGQGHSTYGRYAKGRGVNPLEIVSPELEPTTGSLPWGAVQVSINKTGRKMRFAKTEGAKTEGERHQQGHALALSIGGAEARRLNQAPLLEPIEALPNRSGANLPLIGGSLAKYLRPELHNKTEDYRWGMVIDLDRCTGCGACNVACHAENNIPIVGEEGVKNQREINWIRIERHWEEKASETQQPRFLPMLCQHCGNAPCEPVCPVYATYHTPDGLNAQVYNRCVGTRYCAVNCPYKVRSFNWTEPEWPEPLDRQLNPELSVRSVGVMEKCTFCVQRIRTAKEDAKLEGRKVQDGEVVPACVQACPSDAMRFGSLLDHESAVSKAARNPRRYRALEHLNTESAVVYLKRIIDV